MTTPVAIALVHHPVKNRLGDIVSTAVTNLDIHDLARTAVTYGCERYFLVSPILPQREMVRRISEHWNAGDGRLRNPVRARAFESVAVSHSLEEAVAQWEVSHGQRPLVFATGAGYRTDVVTWQQAREHVAAGQRPVMIVFGTGWGLDDALVEKTCDAKLPAIEACTERAGYNHLPVRAAVAITLDRLLGDLTHKLLDREVRGE